MSSRGKETTVGYIPGIDGLRTVAVLSVLLFHLKSSFLPGGFVGVDIFFVISGFVVTASLIDHKFKNLKELILFFYARRLVRIMPALLVMLLVTMLFSNFFVPSSWLSGFSDDVGKSAYLGVSNIVLALRSDSYFAPADSFDPYLHTWSLGVEEQFYLIFPFLIFWHLRGGARQSTSVLLLWVVAFISLASLALCAWLTRYDQRFAFFLMPPRFWELGLGMLLCLTTPWWKSWLAKIPVAIASLAPVIPIVAIAYAFSMPEEDAIFPFPLALIPTLSTAFIIVFVVARKDGWLSNTLSHPVMVGLGKRSYSLYLWHWPIFVLMRWTTGLHTPLLMVVGTTLALAAGFLSYRLIEQPTRKHRLLVSLPRTRIVAGCLVVVLVCTALGFGMVRFKGKMSLSETSHFALWYADQYKKLSPALSKCAIARSDEFGSAGHIARFVPENCLMQPQRRNLVAIGDSHAVVYDPMLRQFAAATGIRTSLMFNGGCSFLPLNLPMSADPRCAPATLQSTSLLRSSLQRGDILFLPSLRLQRIEDQWSDQPVKVAPVPALDRKKAVKEAILLLRDLRARGVNIVFEAPTPLFRAPAFRCSDWFNRTNPICAPGLIMPRNDIVDRRMPVVAAMADIARQVPGVTIWDPVPTLCSEKVCPAIIDDKPLFFDADHLSGYGTDLLYPSFSKHMERFK